MDTPRLPPGPVAAGLTLALLIGGVLFGAFVDLGDGFTPRVETLDALAGLAAGAFLVDRLLTFIPPLGTGSDRSPAQRTADLDFLRIGYGAVVGALFVSFTDLRAVAALTSESTAIGAGIDRGIAVLAIAGGVAGLARLVNGMNPKPDTDPNQQVSGTGTAPTDGTATIASTTPPTGALTTGTPAMGAAATTAAATTAPAAGVVALPGTASRLLGIAGLGIGALVALTAISDKTGVELVGPETQADGTIALVVRFGTLFLAATIVEQLIERVVDPLYNDDSAKNAKAVITGGLAVALGVGAARILDLYFLHNIGFFGATAKDLALASSSRLERWFDAFVTGVVIAAGTKPLHDFAARLRKAS
jgi:hypothetical protein